jgi:hypothetical protein
VKNQVLQAIADQDTSAWQAVDSNNLSQGQFRLVSYQVDSAQREGTLTVEGRIPQGRSTDTTSSRMGKARLQVVIPINPNPIGRPAVYPGLWLKTLDAQTLVPGANLVSTPQSGTRLAVQGNVFVNDCGVDLATISPNPPQTVASYAAVQTNLAMPSLPVLPTINVPVNSSTGSSTTTVAASAPTGASSPQATALPIVYSLGTVTRSLTLPRPTDLSSPNGTTEVYRYVIDAINLSQRSKLKIDASARRNLLNTSVQVELYVKGMLGSTGKLEHVCLDAEGCQPTDLKIFAYQYADVPPTNGQYPGFCVGSNQAFKGFLFAPGYQVGLATGAKLEGILWAHAWNFNCTSSPDTTTFVQSGNWGNRQMPLPPQLAAIQRWQRQFAGEETLP